MRNKLLCFGLVLCMLLSFAALPAYAAVTEKEVAADSYEWNSFDTDGRIKFGTTNYTLDNNVDLFVNGYKYDTAQVGTGSAKINYVLSKAYGTVKLVKANGAYNYNQIFTEIYEIGQVTNVSYKNEETTVKFNIANADNLGSYKSIRITDNDIETECVKVSVSIDGKKSALKNLRPNDVIAIKTKIVPGVAQVDASNEKIEILATRKTVSGRVTSIDIGTGENAFTVGDTTYAAVNKYVIGLYVGDIYKTIYLDPLGRLYSYDEEAVVDTRTFAILAKVADKTNVTLVLPDGTKKTYEAKDANVYGGGTKALEIVGAAPANVTLSGDGYYADPTECVVEYTLKKGQITSIMAAWGTSFVNAEYKASVSKVGTVGITDKTSVILADSNSYMNYKAFNIKNFVDGEKYDGMCFGKITGTSNYSFVVLTKAGYTFNRNSRFAVVNAGAFSKGSDENGDSVDQLKVLFNGEKTTLNFSATAKTAFGAVNYGDVFFFTTNADGLVDSTYKIARGVIGSNIAIPFPVVDYDSYVWTTDMTGWQEIKLVSGLLIRANANSIGIMPTPTVYDSPVDMDYYEAFPLASDCAIYTYDTDSEVQPKDKLDAEGTLTASDFKTWRITEAPTAAGYTSSDIGKTVWGFAPANAADLTARGIKASIFDQLDAGETAADSAQYVLALIIDDQVVEIYEIIGGGAIYTEPEEPVMPDTNYAILAKVADKTNVTLVLPDGTKKTYETKDANVYGYDIKTLEIAGSAPENVTLSGGGYSYADPIECVVEYTLKNGKITSISRAYGMSFISGEYRESVSKIGNVGIIDKTAVLQADDYDYSYFKAFETKNFVDGEKYDGAAFGRIAGTTDYAFVVLTRAGYTFNRNSRFAVVNAGAFTKGVDEDGDTVDRLKVIFDGQNTTLDFAPVAKVAFGSVNYGDVFFFTTNAYGLVDSTYKIARGVVGGAIAIPFSPAVYDASVWTTGLTTVGNQSIQLVSGMLVQAKADKVGIMMTPTVTDAPVDIDCYEMFGLSDDCAIYTYDTDWEVADKDKLDAEGTLAASDFKNWRITEVPSQAGYAAADIGKIVWGFAPVNAADLAVRGIKASLYDTFDAGEKAADSAQYVLALIVDGKVVEIYEIIRGDKGITYSEPDKKEGIISYVISGTKAIVTGIDEPADGKVIIPETLGGYKTAAIDAYAFYLCDTVKSVVIPATVKSIGNLAFNGCTALKDVYYAGDQTAWNSIILGIGNEPLEEAKLSLNSTGEVIIYGDVNDDGSVNAKDNAFLARHLANWAGYGEDKINKKNADVDESGILNAKDNAILARHLANWTGYNILPYKK